MSSYRSKLIQSVCQFFRIVVLLVSDHVDHYHIPYSVSGANLKLFRLFSLLFVVGVRRIKRHEVSFEIRSRSARPCHLASCVCDDIPGQKQE